MFAKLSIVLSSSLKLFEAVATAVIRQAPHQGRLGFPDRRGLRAGAPV
jgi:hypothetical protein